MYIHVHVHTMFYEVHIHVGKGQEGHRSYPSRQLARCQIFSVIDTP